MLLFNLAFYFYKCGVFEFRIIKYFVYKNAALLSCQKFNDIIKKYVNKKLVNIVILGVLDWENVVKSVLSNCEGDLVGP